MNDDDRKRLTEFLGECLHKFNFEKSAYCLRCNMYYDNPRERHFDNWPDLGAVFEKLVADGLWGKFYAYADGIWWKDNTTTIKSHEVNESALDRWLFRPTVDGKPHFCQLVADFLKEREGNDR